MNEADTTHELAVAMPQGRPLTVGEITAQSMVIHRILTEVMVKDIHYGQIPGTDKPTLFQPGAEKICAVFRLAPKQLVDDLSEPHNNLYRYRVSCSLYTIQDGLFVGAAVGEASSAEEKYSWERAVCQEHWDSTDPTRRRVKFKRANNQEGFEKLLQVQRNAADLANTVLKMAVKRAFISATRGATAASDLLDVDMEEEAVREVAQAEQTDQPKAKPKAKEKPAPSFGYGKHKGQLITDPAIETGYLEFMADKIASGLKEVTDAKAQGTVHARAKFAAQDQLFLAALDAEIAHRKQGQPQEAPKQAEEGVKSAPGDVGTQKPQEAKAPMDDHAWADFLLVAEENHLAPYQATKKAFNVASGHDVPKAMRWSFYEKLNGLAAGK
jgi:hypothetical protein